MPANKKIIERVSSGDDEFDATINKFFPKKKPVEISAEIIKLKKQVKVRVNFSSTMVSPNILRSLLNTPLTELPKP